MALLFETSILGLSVKVFSDRVEYKPGLGSGIEVIPIQQIASIKLGSFLVNRMTIETSGGREYVITTGKKKEVADAIRQAQDGLRASPAPVTMPAHNGSVADELAKLAKLRADGVLTMAEFEQQKAALLGGGSVTSAPQPEFSKRPQGGARAGSSIGRKLKLAAMAVGGLFVFMLIVGIAAGDKQESSKAQPTSERPASAPTREGSAQDPEQPLARLFSDQEETYFTAAGEYLQAVNKMDMKLAQAMAGTQSGEATLDDVKRAIENASAVEADRFAKLQTVSVPSVFATIDTKIKRCEGLHRTAFKELLRYWNDSKTSHIKRGNHSLEQAVKVTNECIDDLNKKVERAADQRKKTASPPPTGSPKAGSASPAERAPSTKSDTPSGPECVENGIAYYKEIGSYPRLSDGRLAQDVVIDRCSRSTQAFQPRSR